MRVRLQSCLLPVILLVSLFFNQAAFSEKKNSVYGDEGDRDIKNYNDDYNEHQEESDRDIIPCSGTGSKKYQYKENDDRKGLTRSKTKKETKQEKTKVNRNNLKNSSDGSAYYVVKNGDTLFSIAKRSGLRLKKILEINNLDESSKIYKGMKLKVLSGNNDKISSRDIRKSRNSSPETVSDAQKLLFLWPLKKVNGYSRDGKDGVKPIGLIIRGKPGSDVIASENGVVKKVGYMRGYGKYIVVKHGKSYITVYSNLMQVDVKNGDTVLKGGRIGNLSDDMILHFQIDREGKPENPLTLLPAKG